MDFLNTGLYSCQPDQIMKFAHCAIVPLAQGSEKGREHTELIPIQI